MEQNVKTPETKKEDTSNPEKQTAKLKNWWYTGRLLIGEVYDHPHIPDGKVVNTSKVLYINKEIGIAETLNTVYILLGKEIKY